jgi:hypothetical protein
MSRSDAGKLGHLASKEIQQKNRDLIVNQYEQHPNLCLYCQEALPYKKRFNVFCNHSCSAKKNNRNIDKPCLNCNTITKNPVYCTKKCANEYRWNVIYQKITTEGKLLNIPSGYGYNAVVSKRYLVETRGHCCEICKGDTWMGKPMPLVLDHINGNPTNHNLDNVRLVCGNCNMQLPTFCGKNIGNGRTKHRETNK